MNRTVIVTWWANKDGKKQRIIAPDDAFEGVRQAYRDAGYVISMTEDWWEEA